MLESAAVHLVTGATGFLGRGLVLEIVRRTPTDRVLCLLRPDGMVPPRQRLLTDQANAARLYGSDPRLLIEAAGRCVAVAGDLRMSAAALREAIGEPLTYVWHCGASLRYLERDRFEIEDTNVGGTAALLTATRALGAERFHYVSTAFVAGERT